MIMDIIVNDQLESVEENCTISNLIKHLNITSFNGIALAINQNVIPREQWNQYSLSEKDKVILIKATQGG